MCSKSLKFILLFFLLFFFSCTLIFAQYGEIPINPEILNAVVKINTISELTHEPISGSGFIVSCEAKVADVIKRIYFLVTNKHVLSDWTIADGNFLKINNFIEVIFPNDKSSTKLENSFKIFLKKPMENTKIEKVEMHKDNFVDIGIVCLNDDLKNLIDISFVSFDISYLLSFDSISSSHFNIGSQVFVLGYPYGITSLENNLPIAKFGFIASKPGELFSIKLISHNRKKQTREIILAGKLLIIDGLVVPGNSGGPVILPSVVKTRINPETQKWLHLAKATENLVIGILSGGFGQSGLSYSFSSDYIIEIIQEYFKKYNLEFFL
jgi:hypothetical protein